MVNFGNNCGDWFEKNGTGLDYLMAANHVVTQQEITHIFSLPIVLT